jgi:hypothetical protein
MKQTKFFALLLVLSTCLFSLNAKAGDNDDHHDNGNHYGERDNPKEGNRVPIDGGIAFLLATGVGYGIKRISGITKKRDIGL